MTSAEWILLGYFVMSFLLCIRILTWKDEKMNTAKDYFQAFLDKAGFKKIDELDDSMSSTEYCYKEEEGTIVYSFDFYEYIFDADGNFVIME